MPRTVILPQNMMRRLLLALIVCGVLLWPASGQAQISSVVCATAIDGWPNGADLSEAITLSASSGDIVVVFGGIVTNRTITVVDSNTNAVNDTLLANYTGAFTLWGKMERLSASITSVTVTFDGSSAGFATACKFAGGADPAALDGSDTVDTSGVQSHQIDTAITTTVANSIFFGWQACGNGTYTRDSDYTAITEQGDGSALDFSSGYRIFTATSSNEVMTVTSAQNESCSVALVAVAGAAAASTARTLGLLGVGDVQ